MCGIFCIIFKSNSNIEEINKHVNFFSENIYRRGPDCYDLKKYCSQSSYDLTFLASVLWTQGEIIKQQPLETDKSLFVYNGDIFEGLSETVCTTGDSSLLLNLLETAENISEELTKLQGPYAFTLFDKSKEVLYFGQDVYGRTSLLLGKNHNNLIITSVAKRNHEFNFMELPSIGTFSWDLKSDEFCLTPFQYKNENFSNKLIDLEKFLNKTINIKDVLPLVPAKIFTEPTLNNLEIYENIRNIQPEKAFSYLLSNVAWHSKVTDLQYLLEISIKRRISTLPKYCQNCIKEKLSCNHSLVGVLFSGGVDCAILALLADKYIEKSRPIDLINVAFDEKNNYDTPDRLTGSQTFEELKTICPHRQWRFIDVNVSQKELDQERRQHIADLIYPLNTVLDDSLGCALWFAGRGKNEYITSTARVLLAGAGADELFGGYTKHRAAFKRGSWLGLHDSLYNDWQNLPHRNLARDDRVVCDHGRLLRTPYLDEKVVEFVRNLPCWEKTYPSDCLPQGFGEKLLLRSLAFHIGLKQAAIFKKRALQFGSRIANKKENANEISERLCF